MSVRASECICGSIGQQCEKNERGSAYEVRCRCGLRGAGAWTIEAAIRNWNDMVRRLRWNDRNKKNEAQRQQPGEFEIKNGGSA